MAENAADSTEVSKDASRSRRRAPPDPSTDPSAGAAGSAQQLCRPLRPAPACRTALESCICPPSPPTSPPFPVGGEVFPLPSPPGARGCPGPPLRRRFPGSWAAVRSGGSAGCRVCGDGNWGVGHAERDRPALAAAPWPAPRAVRRQPWPGASGGTLGASVSLQHPGYYQSGAPEVGAVRLAWAVPKIALHRLQAGRVPCELSDFLQEIHPPSTAPHPLPSASSTLGLSSPCLHVWGCLDLTETSQGIQQCAKSQVWKSRRMQDAVPASLGACEKETGESASVCQTRCFY